MIDHVRWRSRLDNLRVAAVLAHDRAVSALDRCGTNPTRDQRLAYERALAEERRARRAYETWRDRR